MKLQLFKFALFSFIDFLVKNQVIQNIGNVLENVIFNSTRACNKKFAKHYFVSILKIQNILFIYYNYSIIYHYTLLMTINY